MNWKSTKKRLGLSKFGGPQEEHVKISISPVQENGKVKKQNGKSIPEKKSEIKLASYREMLRYADFYDYLLLFFGLFFTVLSGACVPFGAIIFRGITDILTTGQVAYASGAFNYDEFSKGIIYYCFLYFLQGLNMFTLTVLSMGCFYTLSERMCYQIKRHFLESLLNQDQEWFDKNDVGALTQLMSSGIEKIRQGTSDKIVIVIKAIANLVSGIGLAFYFSVELTLVMLVLSPFMVFSLHLCHKTLISQTKKESTAYSVCGSIANEVLSSIKTVISFNSQNFETKRYSESLKKAQKVGFRKALIVSVCAAIHEAIEFFTIAIGFYYGGTLVFSKQISPGTVFGVFWSVFVGALRFGMAVPQFSTLIKAKVSAGEILAMIDTKPKLQKTGGLTPKAIEGKVEFKNVHFCYPSRPTIKVLEDISFQDRENRQWSTF
ncbi:hypothetical protein FO519_004496 [Halicephalobus sp. NKZ332]|nr:hypothetical protein FO519_004496 [Halicephalobus sp. NKZ332]